VLMSQKQYKAAIKDLELSVTDNPTASKYYHKAVAHFSAGENKAAVEAWQKAEALGLSRDAINRMEYEQYDDMKTKIDQLRKRPVAGAEPKRKTVTAAP
jgi:tetratricopeptide (TPR) repeat protein